MNEEPNSLAEELALAQRALAKLVYFDGTDYRTAWHGDEPVPDDIVFAVKRAMEAEGLNG